eukprot:6121674-Pyramimonas_sp.AAC.1
MTCWPIAPLGIGRKARRVQRHESWVRERRKHAAEWGGATLGAVRRLAKSSGSAFRFKMVSYLSVLVSGRA